MTPLRQITTILGAATLTTIVSATTQHHQLIALQQEIAAQKGQAPATEIQPESKIDDRKGFTASGSPTRGAEILAEVLTLIKPLEEKAPPGALSWQDLPQKPRHRLQELMISMDHQTAREFFAALLKQDPRRNYWFLLYWYQEGNPTEAFQLAQSEEPSEDRDSNLEASFGAWAVSDPEAAAKWYREAVATKNPLRTFARIRECAIEAECATDPNRGIADVMVYLREPQPEQGPLKIIPTISSLIKSNAQWQNFFHVLNHVDENADARVTLKSFREAQIRELIEILLNEPFNQTEILVDGCFSPEERRQFAVERAKEPGSNRSEWLKWTRWMEAIDLPVNDDHPLVNFAINCGINGDAAEAGWIEQMNDGELKNRVIAQYIIHGASRNPEPSARLLSHLPKGARRSEFARAIAQSWKSKDSSDAARAFREDEGLEQ